MNEELTKDWIQRAWESISFARLLIWDAHIMPSVVTVVEI